MRSPLACSTAIGLLALAGCGQKGPLYLPDESIQTPVEIRTAPTAAPATPPASPPAGEASASPATPPTTAEPTAPGKERKPETAPR